MTVRSRREYTKLYKDKLITGKQTLLEMEMEKVSRKKNV